MYDVNLTINGLQTRLAMANGVYIKTITGLTGTGANISTAQHSTGYGETYVGAFVSGIPIRIEGYILDDIGPTSAVHLMKERIMTQIVAGGTGTLAVYESGSSYRETGVVVTAAPTITQERHAKFSMQLYAPRPIWHPPSNETIAIVGSSSYDNPTTAFIKGQIGAEYDLRVIFSGNDDIYTTTFSVDPLTSGGKYLHLDFTRLPSGKLTTDKMLRVFRQNGRFRVFVGNDDAMAAVDLDSDLWYLPTGSHTLHLNTNMAIATLLYKPSYAGVILSGA